MFWAHLGASIFGASLIVVPLTVVCFRTVFPLRLARCIATAAAAHRGFAHLFDMPGKWQTRERGDVRVRGFGGIQDANNDTTTRWRIDGNLSRACFVGYIFLRVPGVGTRVRTPNYRQ